MIFLKIEPQADVVNRIQQQLLLFTFSTYEGILDSKGLSANELAVYCVGALFCPRAESARQPSTKTNWV